MVCLSTTGRKKRNLAKGGRVVILGGEEKEGPPSLALSGRGRVRSSLFVGLFGLYGLRVGRVVGEGRQCDQRDQIPTDPIGQ